MQFPSRFVKLDAARLRHGDRVDRFGRFLLQGDPLADATVDALATMSRPEREALIDRALTHGIGAVPDAPDALRALITHAEHVPFWVDYERIDRGARRFLEAGILGGLVLGALSLVAGYCSPAGNKPLAFSGRLAEDVARRLAETSRFVEVVARPGGMRMHADGYRACVKVRLMHASIRRGLLRSPKWNTDAWGIPINQADSAGTLLLFSYMLVQGLDRLGHVMSPVDVDDFLHLWRYAGHVLGVDHDLLCATRDEAAAVWDVLSTTQDPPDDDARALASALIGSGMLVARPGEAPESYMKRVPFAYALSRHLIGDEYADHLGFPRSSWRHAFTAFRAVNIEAGTRLRSVARFEEFAVRAGMRHWRNATSNALRGVPADFAMPERPHP